MTGIIALVVIWLLLTIVQCKQYPSVIKRIERLNGASKN